MKVVTRKHEDQTWSGYVEGLKEGKYAIVEVVGASLEEYSKALHEAIAGFDNWKPIP